MPLTITQHPARKSWQQFKHLQERGYSACASVTGEWQKKIPIIWNQSNCPDAGKKPQRVSWAETFHAVTQL